MSDDWRSRLGPHAIRPLVEDTSPEQIPRGKVFGPEVAFRWAVRWLFAGWLFGAIAAFVQLASISNQLGGSKGVVGLILVILLALVGLPGYFFWKRSLIAWYILVLLSVYVVCQQAYYLIVGSASPGLAATNISGNLIFLFLTFSARPLFARSRREIVTFEEDY